MNSQGKLTEGNSAFRSSYTPGLVPHQKTSAPAPIRRPHADILGDAEWEEEEESRRGDACGKRKKNSGEAMLAGWACGLGVVGEWRRGWVVVVVEAFWWWHFGGGVLVVASCFGPK